MPNPGVFRNARKDWLLAQLDGYGKAIDQNLAAEYIRATQRRFLARWPMSLPLDMEQTQDWLDNVDDCAPIEEPDLSRFSSEEQEKMMNDLKFRKAVSQTQSFLFGNVADITCI